VVFRKKGKDALFSPVILRTVLQGCCNLLLCLEVTELLNRSLFSLLGDVKL